MIGGARGEETNSFDGFDEVKFSSRFRHLNLGGCVAELTCEVFELTRVILVSIYQ